MPEETDPALGGDPEEFWGEPAGAPAGKLFVFLPGLKSPPASYQLVLKQAAAAGYHVVGLAYSRPQVMVAVLCQAASDVSACVEDIRREIITGADSSADIAVDAAHSIDHRLVALLTHLGWQQYLDGDELRWQDITFAGHSLGGGNAAMIAHLRRIHRAVAIAQPWPETGGWLLEPHATPPDGLYGFIHTNEPDNDSVEVMAAWEALGIPGDPTDIDHGTPPYGGAHRLVTSVDVDDPHGAVAIDKSTPLDGDGRPLFAPVWCTLFGP